jgi:hypothetical protein
MERVKEIYRLFKKHQFQLAGLRSFGEYLTGENVAKKRELADALRRDPQRFARVQEEADAKLRALPMMAKGVKAGGNGRNGKVLAGLFAGAAAGLGVIALLFSRRRKPA